MNYEMFLPGDADFVISVLQSISSIMATGYIGTGAAFGAVMALLLAGIKQLTSGTALSWRTTIVTVGLFQAFFGTTQQVIVQDMLTGEADVVTGIPTGTAVAGTIITKTGWSLAELMEQGFSVPGMTQTGLFRDLDTLRRVRSMPYLVPNGGAADSMGMNAVSATQSWANYYRSCIWPYAVQEDNAELRNRVRNSDSLINGLSSEMVNNLVLLTLPLMQGSFTCKDAYTQLKQFTENDYYRMYLEANAQRFGLPSGTVAVDVQARIQASLDNLQGWNFGTQGKARDLVLNTVLYDMILRSYQEESIAAVNDPWSTMLDDARKQRAIQWSGEADMWTAVMPAASSFFIGLVYALTPLIAILIVMGEFGIGLVTKYLSVLLWVMLWPVVMSIVNQYGLITTATEFQAVIGDAGSMTSISALDQVDAVLIEKLALLDKLVASSAVIALFLATGSMYALTQLTSAFSSSDHIDEKKVAPDTYNSSPGTQTSPMNTIDPTYGQRQANFENVAESYNFSSALSNATQAKVAEAEGARTSYDTMLSQGYRMGTQGSNLFSLGENFQQSFSSGSSELKKLSENKAHSVGQGLGLSDGEMDSLTGVLAAQGVAGIGMPGISPVKLGAELQLSGQRTSAEQQQLVEELNARISQEYGDGKEWANEFRDATTADLSVGKTDSVSLVVGNEKAEELSQAATYMTSTAKEATESQNLNNSFGKVQNMSSLAIAEQLGTQPEAIQKLSQVAVEEGVFQAAEMRAARYEEEYGGLQRAMSASLVGELYDKYRDTNDAAGFGRLLEIVGNSMGINPHSTDTPEIMIDRTPEELVKDVDPASIKDNVNANLTAKRERESLVVDKLEGPEQHVRDVHDDKTLEFNKLRVEHLTETNQQMRAREEEIRNEHEGADQPNLLSTVTQKVGEGDYSGAVSEMTNISDLTEDEEDKMQSPAERKHARHGLETP